MSGLPPSSPSQALTKARGVERRQIGDIWQWLGISGDAVGTSGIRRRTFFYGFATSAVLVAAFNVLDVLTDWHEMPRVNPIEPVIWESTSWLTLMALFWITWIGYRLGPPLARPRWRLLVHLPLALIYSLGHVLGFIALRIPIYHLLGGHYHFGDFWPQFFYELRKDALAYGLFIAGFTLIEHLLRQQQLIATPGQTLTFDIRDGARLTRVMLADILAVTSAGNYVEFVLADQRRLLMRSPLSAVEDDLSPRGFVRTHRSWLVNEAAVTGLEPEGSGDYGVALGRLTAPLSRRFPAALARLRGGKSA
jgi:hypothetical protein